MIFDKKIIINLLFFVKCVKFLRLIFCISTSFLKVYKLNFV